ncbi:hypothetical protein quinque_009202 [Culex quinquefasciatus]
MRSVLGWPASCIRRSRIQKRRATKMARRMFRAWCRLQLTRIWECSARTADIVRTPKHLDRGWILPGSPIAGSHLMASHLHEGIFVTIINKRPQE